MLTPRRIVLIATFLVAFLALAAPAFVHRTSAGPQAAQLCIGAEAGAAFPAICIPLP